MTRDTLGELFGQLTRTELPVPAFDGVVTRGEQRRRRAQVLAVVLVVLALLGTAGVVQRVSASQSQPAVGTRYHRPSRMAQRSLQFGSLVLGVNRTGQFLIARVADLAGATQVSGLPDARGFPPLIGTAPDGWVISYAVESPNASGNQPERLALVRAPGVAMPFGPVFSGQEYLTSLAVRPDGSAVAVGVADRGRKPGPARIELIPMPGRHTPISIWRFTSAQITAVGSMSWTPDGSGLTYAPGSGEGGSFAVFGAVTLQVGGPGRHAIARSHWPRRFPDGCPMIAGTWSGGRYLALVVCDMEGVVLSQANPVTGALHYPVAQLPNAAANCFSQGTLTAAPHGQALISRCGLLAYDGKRVRRLPGPMWIAAYEGGR